MARLATIDQSDDSNPPSPQSSLSGAVLKSSTLSSKTPSSEPTSRASSTRPSSIPLPSAKPMPTTKRAGVTRGRNASDGAESAVDESSAGIAPKSTPFALDARLPKTMTSSKQNLLSDGIKALDMDWSMSSPQEAPVSPARKRRLARLDSSARTAASAVRATASALGKRGREAFESGSGKLKQNLRRRASLRARETPEEKAQRLREEEEIKNALPPETGNRPKLPKGWAYVHEPAKKKTRLSAHAAEVTKTHESKAAEEAKTEHKRREGMLAKAREGRIKKQYLDQGEWATVKSGYCAQLPGPNSKPTSEGHLDEFEKKGSFMPYPMFRGATLLDRGRHFRLPFDVFSPLPKEPKPEEWKKIRSNRFVGDSIHLWKHQAPVEMSQCFCTPQTGCGDDCINRGMMYECDNNNCPLDANMCTNRPFATLTERVKTGKKYEIGVEVLQTQSKGFGVRASRTFNDGQIIVEYAGEIITKEECERRMLEDYKGKNDFYLMEFNQSMIIDATRGSIARFVNHSCEPNCTMEQWVVSGKPRMALFAKRDIMTGEELTYDYNFDPFSTTNVQTCHCGADRCRGVIGPKLSKEKERELRDSKSAGQAVMSTVRQNLEKITKIFKGKGSHEGRANPASKIKNPLKRRKDYNILLDMKHNHAPRAKKARLSAASSPAIQRRTSSIRKASGASAASAAAKRRRSAVRISSTSTGGTTLVEETINDVTMDKLTGREENDGDTIKLKISPRAKRRSDVDIDRDSHKRRSVRIVDGDEE